jgi:hypothetical protein
VLALVPEEPSWDVPERIFAAVEYLVLGDEAPDYRRASDPWEAFRSIVVERSEWIAQFVRERTIQTNEPQRSWALLPLFLTIAQTTGRQLDLLELGPSAGLNLLWDRYRYTYSAGAWGPADSALRLRGVERRPVPARLLRTECTVRRRRGVDVAPIDGTSGEGVRTLFSFVTRPEYRDRVRRAVEVLRSCPVELIRGDYVELLPDLLTERDDAALTVVFQTISTIYLPTERVLRLRELVDAAGADGPLAWISTPTPEEHRLRGREYPLELALWPGGERRLVAEMPNGGDWLDWTG